MKKFLLNIGLFVVVVAALAVVGDYMISSGLRKTTIRKYAVWNDIYNGNNLDNDLVIIGASSCWAAYNPQIPDSILNISSYNLAIVNHTWYPCYQLRYNTYARHAHAPKYIVINIDMGTFGVLDEPYEREQFFPYFWIDDSLVSEIQEYKNISFFERYCPLWRYIGYRTDIEQGVLSFFGKKHFEDDVIYKGYTGNTQGWHRESLDVLDSVTIEWYQEQVDSMILFIKRCKNNGQSVYLVKTPIYFELQERFTNKQDMITLYDSIASITHVPLLDYWNHPVIYDSTLFYNPSHLNMHGADVISICLTHDLDSLINITNE